MRSIAALIISVLLALAFIGAGVGKLTAQPMMVAQFHTFGYAPWFMYVTGIIEVVSAVLLFVPRVRIAGVGLLLCVMAGAAFSHLTHGQAAMLPPVILLTILLVVLGSLRNWGRTA